MTQILEKAAIDQGELLSAMDRYATAAISFDISERGIPLNIQVGAVSEATWGREATILVSEWRFKPGMRDGRPVQARCSIDLIWGLRNLTAAMADGVRSASALR